MVVWNLYILDQIICSDFRTSGITFQQLPAALILFFLNSDLIGRRAHE